MTALAWRLARAQVQGPPGTGKTYVSALSIVDLVRAGKRVAISSNSHKAIGNLLEAIADRARVEGVRCSIVQKTSDDGDDEAHPGIVFVSDNDAPEIAAAKVVGATAWHFARYADVAYDYLIVDEAGQVSIANILAMARCARNIVLVGDPMQLPQPLQGSHPGDSGRSCLEYLIDGHRVVPSDRGIFIPISRRMHPRVCGFISTAVYEDRLSSDEAAGRQTLLSRAGEDLVGAGMRAVEHSGRSQVSPEEIDAVAARIAEVEGSIYRDRDGRERAVGLADKLLIGQILVVLAIVSLSIWTATQWAAAQLAYQPELGAPWFIAFGQRIYHPWSIFPWWFSFDAYAPVIFDEAGAIAATGGFVGCGAAILGSLWRARQSRHVTTYGSARWATRKDMVAAGLLDEGGITIGRVGPDDLRHDGPEHVMAFAPTRSGKGVGLVVPTLLSWTGSTVVHDIKGENWQLTAGWRARFSHCLMFNPTDARSARYNPLLEVRRGVNEVRDVQNIADILVDPEGALERRNHWEKTSHSLLVGAILHVLYAEEEKTLARVATFLSDPQRSFAATLRRMMTTNHLGTAETPLVHPVVASAARELLNKSENERSGVLSTAMSFLGLYRDPSVAAVTAASDWRIADLVEAAHPVSLYLVVPPSDISRTKPLIRLILNQIGRRLTEELPNAAHDHPPVSKSQGARHRLLMMLDEFPALGRLDFFETSLAFLAGYGVRAFLIAQSLNQIEKAYGEHNAILDNCHVRIAFATNDERTAKRISDALGTATEQRAMRNYAGHRLAPWLAHVMVSRQETARALMTPGEVMQLAPTDELVLISGHPPIRAKKLRYYEDRRFTARVLPAPSLDQTGCRDLPAVRKDDWAAQVRGADIRLADADDIEGDADAGGLEQARHPAHELEPAIAVEPEIADPLGLGENDADQAAERRAMDRVQGLGTARTVYGVDAASGRLDDLQLGF